MNDTCVLQIIGTLQNTTTYTQECRWQRFSILDLESQDRYYACLVTYRGDGEFERPVNNPKNTLYGEMMIEKAVIDRFENGLAVLLVGETNRLVNVARKQLPKHVKEGTWLKVEFEGEELRSAEIDAEETENAKKRIAEKLEMLRQGDHFK